jgi:hypothetical protein
MLRNFGISLLLFGLFMAGYDGFRVREREGARLSSGTSTTTSTEAGSDESGRVHSAEAVSIPPN